MMCISINSTERKIEIINDMISDLLSWKEARKKFIDDYVDAFSSSEVLVDGEFRWLTDSEIQQLPMEAEQTDECKQFDETIKDLEEDLDRVMSESGLSLWLIEAVKRFTR